ncbi:TM2 domain-containing protein [Ningiella sp. W23]|uniref:TM2 domain-containing protein n=1 Tax=Ningiella sp. W23 TaxID=3023715 RepID=UPI00375675C0
MVAKKVHAFSPDPDFSQTVIDELYCPKFKYVPVAFIVGLLFGIFGGHRFYLGKTLSATAMLLTGGGALVWWLIDMFNIKTMVFEHNREEKARNDAGEPPQSLAFLPSKTALIINEPPGWVARRSSKSRVYGSLFLLTLIGFILGVISGPTGTYEPTIILLIFILASLTAARWKLAAKVPIIAALTRWVHKLRLYYYSVDPGNIWVLSLRPIYGVFFAPFSAKARAEVRLYLELGLIFSILFFAANILEISQYASIWTGISLAFAEFLQTLIFTYLFVAPVGALLTTQILLSRRDWVVWTMSIACLGSIYVGLDLTNGI